MVTKHEAMTARMFYHVTLKNSDGVIVSGSKAAAESWIKRLLKVGCNYFVLFMDVRGPAVMYGWADWTSTDCNGGYYVDWW